MYVINVHRIKFSSACGWFLNWGVCKVSNNCETVVRSRRKSKKQWNRGRFNIILRHVNIWVYWYICICEILKWALATHWWHINQNWPLKLGDGVYAVNAIRLFVLAISTVDAICLTHIANASFAVCSSKVMSNFILISYKFFLEHKPTIAYLKIEWSINLFKYPPSVAYGI